MSPEGGAQLAEIATGLARSLRRAGLEVPISATIDFAEALSLIDRRDPESVFFAGRACLCGAPEDFETYAVTFWAFFRVRPPVIPGGRLTTVPPAPVASPSSRLRDQMASAGGDEDAPARDDGAPVTVSVAYSAREVLRAKDFAQLTEAEMAEAERLMGELRRRPLMRRGRRLERAPGARGGVLDVRATLRGALSHGGDPVRLRRRVRGQRARPVVLLLDVSGSMRPYARAMLRFAHATVNSQRSVEAFTLGTRCTRVTRELSWRDPSAALQRAADAAADIDGGTRLGECLAEFNEIWGVGGVARGATVLVCSDGWDRGDPDVLANAMARLSRVAHRIIWVNPLKASSGYEPLARGIAAALPFTDEFLSGHSLDALDELAGAMSR